MIKKTKNKMSPNRTNLTIGVGIWYIYLKNLYVRPMVD